MDASLGRALLRYRIMAIVVGIGLAVLVFVGIPLQYAAGKPEVVKIVGPFHGLLYIIYLATVIDLWRRFHFTLWQLVGLISAGFIPLLAFYVEHRTTKRIRAEFAPASAT